MYPIVQRWMCIVRGDTEEEAFDNLIDALEGFIISCFERGYLEEVLQESGVKFTIDPEPATKEIPEIASVPAVPSTNLVLLSLIESSPYAQDAQDYAAALA